MKTLQPLVVALAFGIVAPASAQVTSAPAPDRFDAADTNHDGKVDRGEYDNFVAELVLLHDANRDGRLDRSEVEKTAPPAKFDQIDADHDGALTPQEVEAFSDSDFAAMDANGDGVIDRDEAKRTK